MEEECVLEGSLCEEMVSVNIKNIRMMLKALRDHVLENQEMDLDEELYFLREGQLCLNFDIDIVEGGNTRTLLNDCSSLTRDISLLLEYWCEYHRVNMNLSWSNQFVLLPACRAGNEEFMFKRDFAFGMIHILESCQDLVHIVESVCEVGEVEVGWEKVFYIVAELVGEMVGYSSVKGFLHKRGH